MRKVYFIGNFDEICFSQTFLKKIKNVLNGSHRSFMETFVHDHEKFDGRCIFGDGIVDATVCVHGP